MIKFRSDMKHRLRGGSITILCLYVCTCMLIYCISWTAQAPNELLNHSIDQSFLPDTRCDRGQLNGLFGDSD